MRLKGTALLEFLIELTGIDSTTIRDELQRLMEKLGLSSSDLTEDDLRKLAALYLEEIHTENTFDDDLSPFQLGTNKEVEA